MVLQFTADDLPSPVLSLKRGELFWLQGLIGWRCAFECSWKVHPQLKHVCGAAIAQEFRGRHFGMNNAAACSHPLNPAWP